MKSRYPLILIAVIFVFCMTTLMTGMVEARGGRGGGGFSRGGPAARGGFSSRPARQSRVSQTPRKTTQQEQSPEYRQERREARQERRDVRQKRRDDGGDDYYDNYYYYGGVAYVTYVPCSTAVVLDDITYYHCDSTWYTRGYMGGDMVYIVTSAPEGY